jgi:riboflavin synthase
MFTGLILGMGEAARIEPGADEARFTFRPLFPVPDWVKGESVAVNGVCLSVEHFDRQSFTAYASHETLRLSTLRSLRKGQRVNLERALSLGDRLGGHLVSGHADGLATVESIREIGASKVFRMRFPEEFSSQVIAKGSIALDGVSLTVNTCGSGFLEVNVIPETRQATTIAFWKTGQQVNFETDMIGKYVAHMLGAWENASPGNRLTLDALRDYGF